MSVTIISIIVTVLITLYTWKNPLVMNNWIFYPYGVKRNNEWYRFLTSGFLHADWGHLIFNMLSLYFFGRVVEYVFTNMYGFEIGIALFLLIFVGGIIVSDIPTYFKHKDDPTYRALGASGGVSAVIFSSILFNPVNDICLYFFICLPGFILGGLYLIYSYYEAKKRRDTVNHDAHFYGAVYGFVVSLLLVPSSFPRFIELIQGWSFFDK